MWPGTWASPRPSIPIGGRGSAGKKADDAKRLKELEAAKGCLRKHRAICA
ncbi:hypothetical protein GCM10012280_71930 [Wenjunlia tyrosinilytica]|uniref:Uncharacterized protein n=1 Tax=Wenjunlia tyrosinilytica TaxID=1544741 RepID=A0A918A0B0_9ACTN|nr:hypothetical protein GCM10012280_71930 [Wenjunlia tyrosinilytica]